MTYLYRCTKGSCRQRVSLKHHHTWYLRKPKCKSCGKLLENPDNWQMKKNKENVCSCDALHFPHRAGSNIMCIEYKGEVSQEQINEFHKQQRG